MIIDLTEEEREFIERICIRTQIFAMRGLGQKGMEKDREAILTLIQKFRKLDSNLVNNIFEDKNGLESCL